MRTVKEILETDNHEREDLLFDYVASFDGEEDVPGSELAIYQAAVETLDNDVIDEEELIPLVLEVLKVQNQLSKASRLMLDDYLFTNLFYQSRNGLIRFDEEKDLPLGELLLRRYLEEGDLIDPVIIEELTRENEENLPRDSLYVLLPMISGGQTLLNLANTSAWIRKMMNEPKLQQRLKENVLSNKENFRLLGEDNNSLPLVDDDDFVHWYEKNFLSEGCDQIHKGEICADTALFRGEYEYLYKHQLVPSQNALRVWKAGLSRFLVDDKEQELGRYISWLSTKLSLRERAFVASFPSAIVKILSDRYRYSSDFLEFFNQNSRTVEQIAKNITTMLTSPKTNQEILRIQLTSIIQVFGEDLVFELMFDHLQKLEHGALPTTDSLSTLQEYLSPSHWGQLKTNLISTAQRLRRKISEVSKKRDKTTDDKRLLSNSSAILSVLDYLR